MDLKQGYKTTEFWVVIAFFMKLLGLDTLITPEQMQSTVQEVEQLTDQIGVIVTNSGSGDNFWIYMIATVYVAGRMGIKVMEARYGKIEK
ncbi:MAG: hypothetical protein M0P40_09400 [Bacteroidales bacterium]|jgi:hypothetical protein|nr:hypothetical protein [Bacteroidales bacterium]